MKRFNILIFASIYLFTLNIYKTNGLEANVPTSGTCVTNSLESFNGVPISDISQDDSKGIQLKTNPNLGDSPNRVLKRKKRVKKNKRKTKKKKPKKTKKKKKTRKNKKKSKKNTEKPEDSIDLLPEDTLEPEMLPIEDDPIDDSLAEPVSLDYLEDPSASNGLDVPSATDDLDSLDEPPGLLVKDNGPLTESSKKYWDTDLVEPQYIISEWFAILDGKKFNKSGDNKFPYVSKPESDYGNSYLSNKKRNSGYLINSYSSGSKYTPDDDDGTDHFKRIRISLEDLSRTHPDTHEDEIENKILAGRYGMNNVPERRNSNNRNFGGRRRPERRGRSRIYDAQQDFASDAPVEPGRYRKFDEDEVERYGLNQNISDPTPIIDTDDSMGPQHMDEQDVTEIPLEDTSYDISDIDPDYVNDLDIPIGPPNDPITPTRHDRSVVQTERLEKVYNGPGYDNSPDDGGLGQILSNDYDDFEHNDRPNKRHKKKRSKANYRKCKKELNRVRRRYERLLRKLKEQAS